MSSSRPGYRLTFASALYAVLLLTLLVSAAVARFRLPQTPLFDPDYGGYLRPALSLLTGHGFIHMDGRDSLYPSFVFVILKVGGDFRALSIVQHLLGLATGCLLLAAYRRGLLLLRHPAAGPRGFLPFLGFLPAAAYLSAPTAILFEQSIRPEAIFPFFVLLSICLNLEFIHRRWVACEPAAAAWRGAAQMIVSLLAYKLKPSFGFALLFANLPMLVSLPMSGGSARSKIVMVAGGAAFCALVLVWPESVLKRRDPAAATFLPDTLLTIHADQIRDQIAEDLQGNRPSPFPRSTVQALLDRLDTTLPLSRRPENRPYPSLGFNPDYLLYIDSVYKGVLGRKRDAARERAQLGYYYYERAFLHHPGRMLGKIWQQLGLFYHFGTPGHAPLLGKDFRLRGASLRKLGAEYQRNVDLYALPGASRVFDAYSPALTFIAASRQLAQTPLVIEQRPILTFVQRTLQMLYLPGLLAALFIAGWVACTGRWRTGWLLPVAVTLLLLSYNFGNNLTIAVVHSLDVGRYVENQLAYTLLASAFSLLLLGETGRRLMSGCGKSALGSGGPALLPLRQHTALPSLGVLLSRAPEAPDSAGLLAEYRATFPTAEVLVVNRAELDAAFMQLDRDVVIVVDATAAPYPAEGARQLLDSYGGEPADLILGVRARSDASKDRWRRVSGLIGGWHAADLDCGLRLFSRRLYENVPLVSHGLGCELALTLQAIDKGFAVRAVPAPSIPPAVRDYRRLLRLLLVLGRDYRPLRCGSILAGVFFLLGLCVAPHHAAGRHATPGFWELCLPAGLLILSLLTLQTGLVLEAARRRDLEATQLRVRDWTRRNGG